jgi:hypothetical protein
VGENRESRQAQVASQGQLEEMAVHHGVSCAENLLLEAEALAEEFGEDMPLQAVVAAIKNCLEGLGWTEADFRLARERRRDRHLLGARAKGNGRLPKEDEHTGGVDRGGVRDEAATRRVTFRSLLGGRRSSEGLIDERQALANCKPLSTAVLSITPQEHEHI